MTEADHFWMRRALAEAARGLGRVEPNPMVGAVVVRDGQIVSFGHHERFGGPHAEVIAIRAAGEAARGSTLYVTLEPCCHHGKTPPCTGSILAAGISRVVAAHRDPFPRVAGGGLEELRQNGVEVTVGIEEKSARKLNAPYLKLLATGRPYVTAKWAMTLDGKIATASGHSTWISNARSRALVHELRGRMDAIAVGVGTVLADDPLLTARPAGPRTAVRLVLDGRGRLPLGSRLVSTARETPVWVAVTDRAPSARREALTERGCWVIETGDSENVPILPLLEELGRDRVTNLLVEGGGRVLGSFFDAGEVDAIEVYIAPKVEGGSHANGPVRGGGVDRMNEALSLAGANVTQVDGDIRVQATIPRRWWTEADRA